MGACCCRAFALPMFSDAKDFYDEIRRVDMPKVLSGDISRLDRLKVAQLIVPLPDNWDEWPEDAKIAIPREQIESQKCLLATCKMLDREDGRCMIYDARPEMCKFYAVEPTCANPGAFCQFKHCDSCHEGQCKPVFMEQA